MGRDELAVGIDLGTSNSCVAVVQDASPRVFADAEGQSVHASVVHFKADGSVLVGNAAKPYLASAPERTVASAKRMIGRYYFSDEVQKARASAAYKFSEGEGSAVLMDVGGYRLTPQEIGALVLKKMKQVAEQALGRAVNQAVVTVPAYFNDNQRQATRDAGRIAGLDVLRIINEPTAAALAYGYGKALAQRVVVYDLGGGTFDVSVLEIGDDTYEVLSTAGDTFLGGDDIDQRIIDAVVNGYRDQHGVDLTSVPGAPSKLARAAEQCKRQLAGQSEAVIELNELGPDAAGRSHRVATRLTHDELARMSMDLIQRTFQVCDQAMQSAGCKADALDGVIAVGGSTRLPFIRDAVASYFGQQPKSGVDPDKVVALGAALQASSLVTAGPPTMLLDVTPLSLRLGTVGGYTERIIEKNTPVPIERTRTFTTARDNQQRVIVEIFQGESRLQSECTRLAQFEFGGLMAAPRGEVKIEVTFEIDANGIVNASAKDVITGRAASKTIALSSGLNDEALEASRARTEATELAAVGS